METSGERIGIEGACLKFRKGTHGWGVSLRPTIVRLLNPSQLFWGGWDQPQGDDMHLLAPRDHLNVGFQLGILTQARREGIRNS